MRNRIIYRPGRREIETELTRVKNKNSLNRMLNKIIFMLISAASVVTIVCVLIMPVLRIFGSSMEPTLNNGEIVLAIKTSKYKVGDLIGFYYNNKILVKRVIATEGDWVNIDEDGNVFVDDELIDEPYVREKAYGECDIEIPYQVPEGRIFVMGDHRATSVDSRSNQIGCPSQEQLVGRIVFCVWPFKNMGFLK